MLDAIMHNKLSQIQNRFNTAKLF